MSMNNRLLLSMSAGLTLFIANILLVHLLYCHIWKEFCRLSPVMGFRNLLLFYPPLSVSRPLSISLSLSLSLSLCIALAIYYIYLSPLFFLLHILLFASRFISLYLSLSPSFIVLLPTYPLLYRSRFYSLMLHNYLYLSPFLRFYRSI